MPKRVVTYLRDEIETAYKQYRAEHGLTDSEAGRIAFMRLVKKPPTESERKTASVPPGNPNPEEARKALAKLRQNGS